MRLASIDIFPVKGLHGLSCRHAVVEPLGLAHDRRWLVIDEQARFLTQRTLPAMATIHVHPDPDGIMLSCGAQRLHVATPGPDAASLAVTIWRDTVLAQPAAPDAGAWLGDRLGQACTLVCMADPGARRLAAGYGRPQDRVSFADGFPILVANTASLDDLNARLARPVPMRRFRPNLTIETDQPWAEDGWRRLRIGSVVLRVAKPCERCQVPGIDQDTGQRPDGPEPLRTLATYRRDAAGGVIFGQNVIPELLGDVRVGDPVELLD